MVVGWEEGVHKANGVDVEKHKEGLEVEVR